jgi:hypothetical protein
MMKKMAAVEIHHRLGMIAETHLERSEFPLKGDFCL